MVRWIPAIIGFSVATSLFYNACQKSHTDAPVFKARHLFERGRSLEQSSRTQLIIEGIFMLLVSLLYVAHSLSR